jgi:hypothetical protein
MIYESRFYQQPIVEDEDPPYEASEVKTYRITDLPQAEQDRISSLKGNRNRIYKKFILKNKGVVK